MENVRIMVRDSIDSQTLTVLDNSAVDTLHYTNDTLTRFIEGDASVLTLDVLKTNDDIKHLAVGNKLAFVWRKKDYWMTISNTEENEQKITLTAYSLFLELNNEEQGAYKAPKAMSFAEYVAIFDPERTLKINVNEVSDKRITHEWTGDQNTLGRLYSVANVFDAEIEFVTILNPDYSLKENRMNVYRKHDENNQGMGIDRTSVTLRLGKEIKAISKRESIDELYTAITATGKNDLYLIGYNMPPKYDKYGNLEYVLENGVILAVQARNRYPSSVNSTNDRYINKGFKTEYTSQAALCGAALAELKKNCVPEVEYEVDGYFDTNPGDTVTIENNQFNPILIIEARVSEQTESFTTPSKNRTTFSNFKNIGSQISQSLINRMEALIAANKQYEYQIISSNGTVFKNSVGKTTLTARVLDGVTEITNKATIEWYQDGQYIATGKSISIEAKHIDEKSVFRYESTYKQASGGYEVTVTNVNDGKSRYTYKIEASDGLIFYNGRGETTLTAKIYDGKTDITSQVDKLKWYRKGYETSTSDELELTWTEHASNILIEDVRIKYAAEIMGEYGECEVLVRSLVMNTKLEKIEIYYGISSNSSTVPTEWTVGSRYDIPTPYVCLWSEIVFKYNDKWSVTSKPILIDTYNSTRGYAVDIQQFGLIRSLSTGTPLKTDPLWNKCSYGTNRGYDYWYYNIIVYQKQASTTSTIRKLWKQEPWMIPSDEDNPYIYPAPSDEKTFYAICYTEATATYKGIDIPTTIDLLPGSILTVLFAQGNTAVNIYLDVKGMNSVSSSPIYKNASQISASNTLQLEVNSIVQLVYTGTYFEAITSSANNTNYPPVGSIEITTGYNPQERYPGTTWSRYAEGRMLLGASSSTAAGTTGGSSTHSHTISVANNAAANTGTGGAGNTGSTAITAAQMPGHTHTIPVKSSSTESSTAGAWVPGNAFNGRLVVSGGTGFTSSSTGSGSGHTHTTPGHTHSVPVHKHTASSDSKNQLPPYIAAAIWVRTA